MDGTEDDAIFEEDGDHDDGKSLNDIDLDIPMGKK